MDSQERERLDRINREAELERAPDDPRPIEPADSRPLIGMVCAALVATAVILGIMWMNNTPHEGAGQSPVAEQTQPRQ